MQMRDQGSSAEVDQLISNPCTGENETPTPTPTPTGPTLTPTPTPPVPPPPPPTNTEVEPPTEETNKTSNKRKESEVWKHFDKIPKEKTQGKQRAACKYCHSDYACDPNIHGTTSLKRHLKKCRKNPHKSTEIPKQSMLHYMSPSGQEGSLMPHLFNQKRCRRALAEFIICDEVPFRIVEKHGFKTFVKELEPRFQIPSRITMARDCWQLYLGEKMILRKVLKKCCNRVCLTTDCWTSVQNFNYLCLTAHFIDNDWILHKRILSFCMIENHRGETIGRTIEKCLLDWGIDKVFTVTMDNATANDTALAYLKKRLKNWKGLICDGDYLYVRCCAHVLNLVVNDGLKDLKDHFEAIRNAVRYVRSSPARFQRFKSFAESEKLDTSSFVCLDVSTRWNSTYLMLEAALKFQKAFERMEDEDEDYIAHFRQGSRREGPPDTYAWDNACTFLRFLKVFYDVTLKFSSSLHVTSNICFHQIAMIQELLDENIESEDGDPLLIEMSLSMKSKYDKYWGKAENMNPLLFVVVILDPRYKFNYINHMFEQLFPNHEVCTAMKNKVKDTLYRIFDEYSAIVAPETSGSSMPPPSSSLGPSTSTPVQQKEDPGRRWLVSLKQKTSSDPQSELDKYLTSDSSYDTKLEEEFDILLWWKANSSKYRVLSEMARDVLAIPVSTVASESAFSTGGRIVDSYRSSLSSKMTEALICAQNWILPGQSLSEFASKLREFDNFEETENVVQHTGLDDSTVTEVGRDDIMDVD